MSFCVRCGGPATLAIPTGDSRERRVCTVCGAVHYDNPRVVVGALVEVDDAVLLCRRAIEPRRGFWTVPAGFLELGEPAVDGAARETFEETGVVAHIDAPLVHFDIPAIGQIYLLFRAHPLSLDQLGNTDTHSESLEVKMIPWPEIPWDALAFDAVRYTLELRRQDLLDGVDRLHYGAIRRVAGAVTPWGTNRLEDQRSLRLG